MTSQTENNTLQIGNHPAWSSEYSLADNSIRALDVVTNSFCAGGSHLGNGSWVNSTLALTLSDDILAIADRCLCPGGSWRQRCDHRAGRWDRIRLGRGLRRHGRWQGGQDDHTVCRPRQLSVTVSLFAPLSEGSVLSLTAVCRRVGRQHGERDAALALVPDVSTNLSRSCPVCKRSAHRPSSS